MSTLARARLMQDIKEINQDSVLGVSCGQDGKDALQLKALLFGDFGTKYEHGMFKVTLNFSEDYPFAPPLVKFDSEIFHPNINKEGDIDIDILRNWLPSYSLTSILTSIKSVLSEPCPSWPSPANPEATDLFLENRSQYDARVKAIVERTFCETAEDEAICDTEADAVLETKKETSLLKPELFDVKASKVLNLRRNSSFNKVKKVFSRGDGDGANTEAKEGEDELRGEVSKDGEAGEGKVEVAAAPEEKSAAAGDSKVTMLMENSLVKIFSLESGDNEVGIKTFTNKEGIEEQCPDEGAGNGLREKPDVVSKVTFLKKRMSFKAIKSRFSKEKKGEEEGTPEGGKRKREKKTKKNEVKTEDDECKKAINGTI